MNSWPEAMREPVSDLANDLVSEARRNDACEHTIHSPWLSGEPTGYVHSIETLGALDGPALRMIIFLQGCPLRCLFCHNPDTWQSAQGQVMTVRELTDRAKRMKPYFTRGGGVTLSGGEPLFQPDFLAELLEALKQEGIHTVVDTSGWCLPGLSASLLRRIIQNTDLFLLDIKGPTADSFRDLTGQPESTRTAFMAHVSADHKPIWLRHVLIPGINDATSQLDETVSFVVEKLRSGFRIEQLRLLPYHTLGHTKYEQLGFAEPLAGYPAMTANEIHTAAAYLRSQLQALAPEFSDWELVKE